MAVEVDEPSPLSKTQQVTPSEAPGLTSWNLQRGDALGRYLVVDVLGRGGMSVVYAAFDPELDRKVAIKLVLPEFEGGTEATVRLLREAQAMAKVIHPHVVSVHDVGTWAGRVFIAMELIDGTTLREWLRQQPRTRREVLAIFHAAGQGLAAAHAAGLVHRDFKPDNVLVDKKARARVTDFGLVRPVDASVSTESIDGLAPVPTKRDSGGVLTEAGAVLGTPAYMAPEQLLGKVADARADQFGFAVALYEALYGERPFEAHDFASTFTAVTNGRVKPAPAGSRVPGHLRRVLLRALSVSPEQRFPSMQALLTALEQDPLATLRRFSVGLGLVLLALSGPGFVLWRAQHELHRCESTAHELDGIWDPARRAQLERVFSAPAIRPGAWERVGEWADRYAEHWKEARLLACEGDRTGHDDRRLVAASSQCIQARRLQLKAVIDLLLTSDADALELADRAFDGVGDVKACVGLLEAGPRATSSDEPLVEQLARARARILLGRITEGEADASAALKEARARGQQGLAAAAQMELGRVQYVRGHMENALALYREALLGAEASGEAELGFEIRLAMGQTLTEELERYDEGLWVLKQAEATAQRLSLPPDRRATLLFRQATALEQAGHAQEALPLAEQAVKLSRESASRQLTVGLLALANLHSDLGHPATSNRYYEEYLTSAARSGLRVSEYAIPLSYSAEQLVLLGEYQRGLEQLQRARAALAPLGGHAIQAVLVEAWISFAAASLGDVSLSQEARARALGRQGELSQPHHLAELLQMLAWVDLYQGRNVSSAKGSSEALRVLSPVASANRAAMLENTVGLAEALRRQGHFEEALRALEPAVAEAARENPEFDQGLANARVLVVGLKDALHRPTDQSVEVLTASFRLQATDFGEDNPDLAFAVMLVGRAELARGRTAEGLAALEHAVKMLERRPGDPWALAEARFELARALAADPSAAARSNALAKAAHEALRALPEATPLSLEVARWSPH